MGIFDFLKKGKQQPGEKKSPVPETGNPEIRESGKTNNTNAQASEGNEVRCCFCGKIIKGDEIRRINKPGYEKRADPYWFCCKSCERVSGEDLARLKQFEGYNQYAYNALEGAFKRNEAEKAYQEVKKYSTLLTSQLAALWLKTHDQNYREEFLRRISLCGVEAEKAERFLAFECGIISACPRPELLRQDFVSLPLLNLREPFLKDSFDYYQTHFEYPLSYIVKLSDEGEWHFWYSHEKDLPDKVWEEIFMLSDKNMALFRPYAMNLIDNMGWTFQNVNRFSFFEQKILDVYRWKKASPESVRIWFETRQA